MWKKGHVRRNWMERWFVLRPSFMAYYASEDLKDKKGEIPLDQYCVVEVILLFWFIFQSTKPIEKILARVIQFVC
jgi:hypothetical protein